jgi:hypothetical protein
LACRVYFSSLRYQLSFGTLTIYNVL